MATEEWSIVEDEIKNLFPTDKIIEVIGRDQCRRTGTYTL